MQECRGSQQGKEMKVECESGGWRLIYPLPLAPGLRSLAGTSCSAWTTRPTCITQRADIVCQANCKLAVPGAPGAGATQSQAGRMGPDAGLGPQVPHLGLQPALQLELSRQGLAAVLGKDTGHAAHAGAVPCLLMLVPQEEAQHS